MLNYECKILLQFGLPCLHHLFHYFDEGAPIPQSLCHPRWWVIGGAVTVRDWEPFVSYSPRPVFQSQPFFSTAERRLLELRETLDSEGQHRMDKRRVKQQEIMDEELLELTSRQVQIQAVPVAQPDPVVKRAWVKAKTHGRADARGLTADELGARRQQQEARREAENRRVAEAEAEAQFVQQLRAFKGNQVSLK